LEIIDSVTRSLVRLTLALAALLFISACDGDSPTGPTSNARFSQTDLVVGTGPEATSGATLNVQYSGWFYNGAADEQKGARFDMSGPAGLTFVLGAGQVIKGWEQGIGGMKVGGTRRLVIPPSLAYGGTRNNIIPANATLLFEVTLVSVNATAGS
jgi:FKBP-type peptidyl-prolyl cis-trans isomerase FkpA